MAPTALIQSRTFSAINSGPTDRQAIAQQWPRGIIRTDECWRSPQDEEIRQSIHHIDGVELPVNTDSQSLPCELINDIQRAVNTPVVGPVMDEVIGPDMIGTLWPEADAGSIIQPQPSLLWLLLRYFKPLTPPYPFNPLMIYMPTRLVQQSCHAAIAVSTIGASQLNDVCCQAGFVCWPRRTLALR